MTDPIKLRFGKRFRAARDAKKLSRAALGLRLGVSPKTIQSWEMGRTFIENLSLIPAIEVELGICVSELIEKAVKQQGNALQAAEAPATYAPAKKVRPSAGPLTPSFEVVASEGIAVPDPDMLQKNCLAVPVIKPRSTTKPVAELKQKDIAGFVVIPSDWAPRGGVLVAYRMSDSAMVPMIPLGATVIVDRRPTEVKQVLHRIAALNIQGRGARIRRLVQDYSGQYIGQPAQEGMRGKAPFRPERGDEVLGRVIGVIAQSL